MVRNCDRGQDQPQYVGLRLCAWKGVCLALHFLLTDGPFLWKDGPIKDTQHLVLSRPPVGNELFGCFGEGRGLILAVVPEEYFLKLESGILRYSHLPD